MIVRRLMTVAVATGATIALAAGPASAHFCYKIEQNANSAAGKAGSSGWATFAELAAQETGLCPAGIAVLADAAGVSVDTTIKTSGVMAGGTLKKEDGGGNPAIDHLDFEAIEAAIPDAVEAGA